MVSKGSPPVARRERRALPRIQRGAPGNPPRRFEVLHIEPEPDETCAPDDTASARGVPTLYFRDASRSIISSNTSPDVPFDRSVNPVPRLRARLQLLLRAAHARVPRSVGRARFRDADLRQATRA